MLTSSSGTNYVLSKHDDVDQYNLFQTIRDNAISKTPWKSGEPKWYPYWVIMLTSSSGTNYVPKEHEDVDQYDSYAIPSKIIPC